MSQAAFLSAEQAAALAESFGTPVFVYSEAELLKRAEQALSFPCRHGLTVRYAMKALPTAAILRLFDAQGIHIDASSGYEAERAMRAGIAPDHIQLTAQEMPSNLADLLEQGVLFNACSLRQLARYGELRPGSEVSVRINPGLGSGHSQRTNVGGPSSSFGIWHEHLDTVKSVAEQHGLRITGMHTHIGSGSDPETWVKCAQLGIGIAAQLPDVTRLSLGGGYKIARMPDESPADLRAIGARMLSEFELFEQRQGRKLHLEIEPGTFLVANAGALISTVIDVVDTGAQGMNFIKLDTGMSDILRPSMYGAQHPITFFAADGGERPEASCMVVGHCCESGDILTPERGNPEALAPRMLPLPEPGDLAVIDGAGAYCASMAARNYNSFPESAEVLLGTDGTPRLIRKRQTLDQFLVNEV
ncbi:MAG: diaminopimelate decarboxylase [Candidatus Hydrogenedens sp.]|nr:diaminopimelate decarboxylase [Candidatus Hydrogenedens sp.]